MPPSSWDSVSPLEQEGCCHSPSVLSKSMIWGVWCRKVTQQLPCPLSLDSQLPWGLRRKLLPSASVQASILESSPPAPPGPLLVLFSLHGSLPLPRVRKQDSPEVDQIGCSWSDPEERMELPRASGLRKQELQRPRHCAPGRSPWPGLHTCSLTSSLPSPQRARAVFTLVLPMGKLRQGQIKVTSPRSPEHKRQGRL